MKPRIVIVDENYEYIMPLQLKFMNEFFEKINLEVITDVQYFDELFSMPQNIDILIISENLYNTQIQRHNINHIFVMKEQNEEEQTTELNINKIYKYTSIKEIFNEIVGKSEDILNASGNDERTTQVIVVTSANGGVGKTTVSLGLSSALSNSYKKVLYINVDELNTFQYRLEDKSLMGSTNLYVNLMQNNNVYETIKSQIKNEGFDYVPAFKSPLESIGLNIELYKNLIEQAKASSNYDFIVVDTNSVFNMIKTELFEIADNVIILTTKNKNTLLATNDFVSHINGITSGKYLFISNNSNINNVDIYREQLRFSINESIGIIENCDDLNCRSLGKQKDIQNIAYLLI